MPLLIALPVFVYGPAEPRVFELLLDALGEPESVEVRLALKDWRSVAEVAEVAGAGVEGLALVSFKCKPGANGALELYRRYFEARAGAKVWSFRAKWQTGEYDAVFNGFRLRIVASELADDLLELLNLLGKRGVEVEVDLSEVQAVEES